MNGIKRIVGITGSKGSGKSTAAVLGFVPASEYSKVLVVDTEDSLSDIVLKLDGLGLSFGAYVRMYDRFGISPDITEDVLAKVAKGEPPWVSEGRGSSKSKKSLVEYYEYFVRRLDELLTMHDGEPQFHTLVIDTMGPVLASMVAAVIADPNSYGWSKSYAYGRLETEGVRPLWENLFEAVARRGITQVILTSHIKSVWRDDKPVPNKVRPGGRTAMLARMASLWLWLMKDTTNETGAPAALVLKARLGKLVHDKENDRVYTRQILPERIPALNSWLDVCDHYMDHPANFITPAPGEKMSVAEQDMISEFMNSQQMRLMMLGAELDLYEAKQEALGASVVPTTVAKSPPAVPLSEQLSTLIKGKYEGVAPSPSELAKDLSVPLPVVARALKSLSDG